MLGSVVLSSKALLSLQLQEAGSQICAQKSAKSAAWDAIIVVNITPVYWFRE
jgi:hypothetical protein